MNFKCPFVAFSFTLFIQSFQVCGSSGINISLEDIKKTYQAKNFSETIHLSDDYLKNYPQDADVSLYKGLAYNQLNQCHHSEPIFNSILLKYPDYLDARIALIDCCLKLKSPTQALYLAKDGLKHHPDNAQLRSLKAKAQSLLKSNEEKTYQQLTKAPTRIPVGPRNRMFEDIIPDDENQPRFIAGVYTDNMGVNIPKQYWNLSNLYGYWINSLGAFGGGVNYASRYHNDAAQLELDASPKLGNNLVLDLTYANANTPELFPDQLARAELFSYFAHQFEASVGGTYRKIAQYHLDSYTGSVGKYWGNYYLNFRPIYFVPGSGPRSVLYRLGVRHYGEDPRQYIGLVLMDGTSPDLTDLLTVDFIKIRDRLALIEVQQPINKVLAIQYGAGYEEMLYPNNLHRTLVHFNLGFKIGFM